MMTDASDLISTPTMTGLFVAGLSLGAVYAFSYVRLGQLFGGGTDVPGSEDALVRARAHTHTKTGGTRAVHQSKSTSGEGGKSARSTAVMRKGGKKRKGKKVGGGGSGGRNGDGDGDGVGVGDEDGGDADEGVGQGRGDGRGEAKGGAMAAVPLPQVVPGNFEGVNTGAVVGSPGGSSAMTAAKRGTDDVKTQKKTKTKKQKQKQKQGRGKGTDEDKEAGSETGKEVDVARTTVHRPRSGESTDASVSLSPSVSGDALSGSSREMGKVNSLAPLSQPHPQSREIRLSLSFDTDSSWSYVNRRHLKLSKSMDGQARGLADAIDVTSSDLASTASDSPVAEHMDNVTADVRGPRADLAQRTLAEKLVPRPKKTGVDDMLEQPDVPTLARVIRVQPRPDETPVPGFSWEDYGDVVEDSVLVHDADEEDEGDWGVVTSRNRTRPPQTTAMAAAAAASTSASLVPEALTKKQRQNARKRELAKAAKAQTEAARLQGLAKHKRELERLWTIEQSQRGGGKQPSGGMHATVDDQGKLVWE